MADKRKAPRCDVKLVWNRISVGVSFLAIILYLSSHYAFHVKVGSRHFRYGLQ